MTNLPTHIEFEYVFVTHDDGTHSWAIHPYHCVAYDEENQEFIWEIDVENVVFADTEEKALQYIHARGILSLSFKNKLN